jgi:Ni/Co efflux regulator RcnB
MKKIALAIAAVSALAVALPSLASAETVVIKKRGHHHVDRGWHHYHADRGWHRGHGNKVVVIKHGHHHYD